MFYAISILANHLIPYLCFFQLSPVSLKLGGFNLLWVLELLMCFLDVSFLPFEACIFNTFFSTYGEGESL